MNFSETPKEQDWEQKGSWSVLLSSSDKEWGGPADLSPRSLTGGMSLTLPAHSITVCLNV